PTDSTGRRTRTAESRRTVRPEVRGPEPEGPHWGGDHLLRAPHGGASGASPGQPQPGEALPRTAPQTAPGPHIRHAVPVSAASCDRYHRSGVTLDLGALRKQR